ncbi:MAG: NifB/NifX family molybdenum-iron cluster-binding protein [Candidatus Zixiibacteriota bacterium]
MIVAVPKYNEAIAPRFEVARYFLICVVEGGQQLSSRIFDCSTGCEGFGRVRLLRDKHADVLICNGIKSFYRDLLEASGVTVIPNVTLPVSEAMQLYLAGQLQPATTIMESCSPATGIPHEDLVCWARELFESNGYSVRASESPFPIDLIAEITCPVCRKPVRVAICCGAHTYRTDQEIRELHRVAASDFHAQVYVHPGTPAISRCCQEYGVQLIDPDTELKTCHRRNAQTIPVLAAPVPGHERAFAGGDAAQTTQ